jgi:hypothetical protein
MDGRNPAMGVRDVRALFEKVQRVNGQRDVAGAATSYRREHQRQLGKGGEGGDERAHRNTQQKRRAPLGDALVKQIRKQRQLRVAKLKPKKHDGSCDPNGWTQAMVAVAMAMAMVVVEDVAQENEQSAIRTGRWEVCGKALHVVKLHR